MPDINTLVDIFQRQGLSASIIWVFGFYFRYLRFLGLWYFDVHHYRCEIPNDILLKEPRISVVVEDISPALVESMRPWLRPGKEDLFIERLNAGIRGLVCLHQGEVVYFTWFTDRDEYDISTRSWVRLAPREGYLFDSFCRPAFRGYGLHSFMNAIRLKRLRELGCVQALGKVHTTNFSSRWTLAANGFWPIDRVIGIGVGRRVMKIKRQSLLLKWEKSCA